MDTGVTHLPATSALLPPPLAFSPDSSSLSYSRPLLHDLISVLWFVCLCVCLSWSVAVKPYVAKVESEKEGEDDEAVAQRAWKCHLMRDDSKVGGHMHQHRQTDRQT